MKDFINWLPAFSLVSIRLTGEGYTGGDEVFQKRSTGKGSSAPLG